MDELMSNFRRSASERIVSERGASGLFSFWGVGRVIAGAGDDNSTGDGVAAGVSATGALGAGDAVDLGARFPALGCGDGAFFRVGFSFSRASG